MLFVVVAGRGSGGGGGGIFGFGSCAEAVEFVVLIVDVIGCSFFVVVVSMLLGFLLAMM